MFISSRKIESNVFINKNVNKKEVKEVKEVKREFSELDKLLDEFKKKRKLVITKTGSKSVSGWCRDKIRLVVDVNGDVIGRKIVEGEISRLEEINRDINKLYVEKWLKK